MADRSRWDLKSKKASHVERECLETEGRGIPTHKPPVRKTCGPIMAPPSAARRSRGCGVRTDGNAGTRKGESDYLAGIKMPFKGTMEVRWNGMSCRALTSGGAHRRHAP